ncbi:MAG: hypothetical protein ACFFCO_10265 [Promethearchaeota archaeon]
MDPFTSESSGKESKVVLLRQMIKLDLVKKELLSCLVDGLWHSTTKLARRARMRNPIIGIVTVGTILIRMQELLGREFLEEMVQKPNEGITSWRLGVEWMDAVREFIQQVDVPPVFSPNTAQGEMEDGQST